MSELRSPLLIDLKKRGFLHQATHLETLDAHLAEGSTVSVYAGFDCTADSLHVGNLMTLMLLRRFHRAGHRIVPLIGTTTTLIGDPSGKDSTRPEIPEAVVWTNAAGIRESIGRVLGFAREDADDHLPDSIRMRRNSEWLMYPGPAWVKILMEVGRAISVNRMLTLDSVRTRLERDEHLNYLEFNYSVMQGYDFLTLARQYPNLIQVGGSDQWGNITMGTDLISRLEPEIRAWGLTHPLLTTPDGRKMGKSEAGTAVWLNADKLSDFDFWQYWRNVPDAMVGPLMKLFTDLEPEHIDDWVAKGHEPGINGLKEMLATQVTTLIRGSDAACAAADAARAVFRQGAVPTEGVPEHRLVLDADATVRKLAHKTGLCRSGSDAGRKLAEGGVRLNGEVLKEDRPLTADDFKDGVALLSLGKKTHRRLVLE